MENKKTIAIIGMGGVGGFIGAKLAAHYRDDSSVEINFIARGESLENIATQGIILDTAQGQLVAQPNRVTDKPAEIGHVDFLLLCTKSYDLEQAICEAIPCVGPNTVVIPFLNGVDAHRRIQKLLPGTEVWFGCVYIYAQIIAPGHITEDTRGYKYLYGPKPTKAKPTEKTTERLEHLDQIFKQADIQAYHSPEIELRMWNKFAYISTVATLTAATDKSCGEIHHSPELMSQLETLLAEFCAVAAVKHVPLSENITQEVIKQMVILPAETTTSMQRDFRAGKRTEVESLTGYILRQGQRRHAPTPTYAKLYNILTTKH